MTDQSTASLTLSSPFDSCASPESASDVLAGGLVCEEIALIGLGLIGSSLARAIRQYGLATRLIGMDADPGVRAQAQELGLVDRVEDKPAQAVRTADLVILCTPVGCYMALGMEIIPAMRSGAILSDVGSVKQAPIQHLRPFLRPDISFVPAHPIAGTENSGPDAGFATLFTHRWCILTPFEPENKAAVRCVEALWKGVGAMVTQMSAEHHDRVLAITSHLPHLIAYTIVGTASDLEQHLQAEVIKFSAAGFFDFTRVAASDPVMWRDIFLYNREAILEMVGRLYEDIAVLQRAVRLGDGPTLEGRFRRAQEIRRQMILVNR